MTSWNGIRWKVTKKEKLWKKKIKRKKFASYTFFQFFNMWCQIKIKNSKTSLKFFFWYHTESNENIWFDHKIVVRLLLKRLAIRANSTSIKTNNGCDGINTNQFDILLDILFHILGYWDAIPFLDFSHFWFMLRKFQLHHENNLIGI